MARNEGTKPKLFVDADVLPKILKFESEQGGNNQIRIGAFLNDTKRKDEDWIV